MKRILTVIVFLALTCSSLVVYAEKEAVAQTQETEVTCSIDKLFIESYAVNGFMYLPIERLTDYGFNLEKTSDGIELKRNKIVYLDGCYDEVDTGSGLPVYENPTTIIVKGKTANTYLIEDRIVIQADELQAFGDFTWNEDERRISVSIIIDELIEAYVNAENLVIDPGSGSGFFLGGQQDENGVWNGIVQYGVFQGMTYTGYMIDGEYEGAVFGYRQHKPFLAAASEFKTVRNGVKNGYCWYSLGYNNKPPTQNELGSVSGMYEDGVLKNGTYTKYIDFEMNTATYKVENFKEQIISSTKSSYYEYEKSPSRVFYKGEPISFDVEPVLEDQRTLIPLRGLFEKMGAVVEWDNETQTATVTKNNMVISVKIDYYRVNVNGSDKYMDTPARLVENRTMIPLRFLSEELGYDVIWDESDNSIRIK